MFNLSSNLVWTMNYISMDDMNSLKLFIHSNASFEVTNGRSTNLVNF